MKKIDLLIGPNDYSTVVHFSRSLGRAFKKLGIKVRTFSLAKEGFHKVLQANFDDPCDLTFSFSDIRFQGKSLGSVWQIPHFTYLLDPAIYYLHQLKGPSFVSCIDKKDLQMALTLNKKSLFLPHAVDRDLFKKPQEKPLYDVVMIGTCHDVETIKNEWQQKYGQKQAKYLEECARGVLSSENSILEILSDSDNIPLWHHEIDLFVGAQERIDLLSSLKGVSLHIWGKGPWKKYVPHAHVSKGISFSQTLKIFSQAKIVLNTSHRFQEGGHERILYSLALHALPLTNENNYIREVFKNNKSILTFKTGKYEGIQEKIAIMLSSEKKRCEIVEEGRVIALNHHTWNCRAHQILRHLKSDIEDIC